MAFYTQVVFSPKVFGTSHHSDHRRRKPRLRQVPLFNITQIQTLMTVLKTNTHNSSISNTGVCSGSMSYGISYFKVLVFHPVWFILILIIK